MGGRSSCGVREGIEFHGVDSPTSRRAVLRDIELRIRRAVVALVA